jgi:hypothetical protein
MVCPPNINFEGVKPNLLYALTFSVQNSSNAAKRIRIIPPTTPNFSLVYKPVSSIASGLDIRGEIEFQLPNDADGGTLEYHDSIKVICEGTEIVVPIVATLPTPKFSFDSFCDIGYVCPGVPTSKKIEITNLGSASGNFRIVLPPELPVTITPLQGFLNCSKKYKDLDKDGRSEDDAPLSETPTPGSNKASITIDFEGVELGPFRALAEVFIDGETNPRILDISAQVVASTLELVHANNSGAIGESMSFGRLVYGQSKSVEGILVNNGPSAISYSLTTTVDKSAMEDADRADGGGNDMDDETQQNNNNPNGDDNASNATNDDDPVYKTITVTPTEGIIEPFSQLPIKFTFSPNLPQKARGFTKGYKGPESQQTRNFVSSLTVEGSDVSNKINLMLTGKAVKPSLSVSDRILRFGECRVHERRDILITLKNDSELTLPYNFTKIPNFTASPKSGFIKPQTSQSCVLSFVPGQMGKRKNIMNLIVANGMDNVDIRCMGTGIASAPGITKTMTGGPNVVPSDFVPNYNFVKSEDPTATKNRENNNTFVRINPWDEVDLLEGTSVFDTNKSKSVINKDNTEDDYNVNKDTFSRSKLNDMFEHRKKYSAFLKDSRIERENKSIAKKTKAFEAKFGRTHSSNPNSTDIGIDRDVDEPMLPLPAATEGLWLQRPLDGSTPSGGANRIPIDENRLITKKFKPAPTTQAEVRDCEAELSSQELLGVVSSTKVLDFGQVVVGSTTAKNFCVSNDLTRTIIVTLNKLESELDSSYPGSQVVPSSSTAGFDIKFASVNEGKYKRQVQYTVNNKHIFKFTVIATVVPVSLLLNTSVLGMSFAEQSLEQSVTETIIMTNPGNAVAEFSWSNRRAFTVKPERGTIPAYGDLEIDVTWTPSPAYKNDEVLSCHVPGGDEIELTVKGELNEAKCKFKQNDIDFKLLAVGIESDHTVELKNTGKSPAVVFVDSFGEGTGITCKPDKARIPVGQSVTFTLTVKPPMPCVYNDIGMSVSVRGGKMLRIPIVGEAVVPKVSFVEERFDFENVVIGNCIRMPVRLCNEGTIPASLQLDLAKYPDFSLCEVRKLKLNNADYGMDATPSQTSNSLDPVYLGRGDDDELAHKWKIIIDSGQTYDLELMYKPTTIGTNDFMLPLMFQGISTDGSLKRQITATGLKPRLIMSETTCDFEDRVVQRDPGRRIPYTKELTFTNDTSDGVSWELDDNALRPVSSGDGGNITATALWFVSPKRGNLSPGEQVTVRVTFSPQEDVDYETELPLYLADQEDRSRPYLNLGLRGSGVYPRITFSVEEVLLPTVPLNVVSRAKMWIINDGYDNLDLTHKLALNCQIPLDVEFPKGKNIGMGTDRIPVIVSYSSDKPVSLNTKIDFFDADGSCYSINVIGAADNSLFTNFPFLANYADNYKYFTMDGAPVCLYDKKQVLSMQQIESKKKEADRLAKRKETEREMAEALAAQNAPPSKKGKGKEKEDPKDDKKKKKGPAPLTMAQLLNQTEADGAAGIDVEQEEYLLTEDDVYALKFWLNANVMVAPIVNFPGDFLDTNGKTGIDAIEMMCGKKVPGKVKKLSTNKNEHWSQLQTQYKELMLFMKQHGGLLAGVRPENLLQRNHFMAAKEFEAMNGPTRVTAAQLKARKQQWESNHGQINKEAWAALMFQAIRVFVLGRVTPKGMAALPGVLMPATTKGKDGGKKSIDSELEGSNLYSLGESCLLKWVSYHVNQNMTTSVMRKRVTNFEADFCDGSILCHLLANHLPQFCQQGGILNGFTSCSDTAALEKTDARQANIKRVLEVFKLCRMDFGATAENLLRPTARLMVMFVLHLYQALPQMIPKTAIDFSCTLNDTMKKSIALTNPSGKSISYQVTLEGCQDFSIESNTVSLDPKSVTQFIVSLTPRFSKPQEARLTFWTQKDGGPMASNLVFLLKSTVSKLKAVETFSVDAKNFEATSVSVTVKNPYDKTCTFLTEIQQSLTAQFTGMPGVSFPLPETIFGPALNRSKSRKRVGTAGSTTGRDPNQAAADEAAALELEDKKTCLGLLGKPLYIPESTKIKLNPGEETTVTVQVLCFVPGTYTGHLILLDEQVGQFAYEIVVNCGLPPVSSELTFDLAAEDEGSMECEKLLKIPARNAMVERAAMTVLERMNSAVRTRCRNILLSFLAPPGPPETGGNVRYRCIIDSPYFQGSPDIIMRGNEYVVGPKPEGGGTPSTGTRPKKDQLSKVVSLEDPPEDGEKPLSNYVGLSFYPKEAGNYPVTVTIMPFSGEADMRTYSISATVTTQPKETSLDFKAPARQNIVQEIPISNNGPEDWTLSCVVGGSKSFSGPASFKVPANSTASYPLSFKPSWICEETGTLNMKNAKLGTNFVFNLSGVGEEPLAEKNIVIKAGARESLDEVIELPALGAKTYSIETDLPYVTGPSTITTGESNAYTMNVNPQTGGNFSGQITFTDEKTGMYVWYTVELVITAPAAEAEISISAECRQASVATISLSNPTDDPIIFDVGLYGDGIIGDKFFTLKPNGSSTYELYYSPLISKKHEGTVSFTNELAGEFWYKLNLVSTPAPAQKLETMSCPVGGKCKQRVFIQNPLGKEVKLASSCMNSKNYSISPGGPKLPPYGEGFFDVVYTPSSLGDEESSRIDLTHPELGNFVYFATGSGGLPGVMDEEHCPTSIVNDQTTYPFKFRNPFNAALTVDIILETDDDEAVAVAGTVGSPSQDSVASSNRDNEKIVVNEIFKLLPKKTREIVMAPFTSIQIPISFSPDSIEEKGARLVVRGEIGMKRDLVWIYNIRGLAEAPMGRAILISCPAKKVTKIDASVGLYGLNEDGLAPEGEDFEFAVEYPTSTEAQEYYLREWLTVTGTNLRLDSPDGSLDFRMTFQPLRPFVAGAELVVTRSSTGGRWKFPIRVDVGDAEPEQEPIMIEAAIKTIKKVVFKLTNRTPEQSQFQAFFTVDSAKTLTVEPSVGLLQGAGSSDGGSEFFISYAPEEYGKAEKGRLIIQTDEVQWIYDVHTRQPGFIAPDAISRIDNRLDPGLEKSLGTSKLAGKNIITENMKASKLMAGRARNEKANMISKQIKALPNV